MSIFKIKDGRAYFWQWDLGRKLIVDCPAINEVHFANDAASKALVLDVYEADGLRLVDVPNILLQYSGPITVHAYVEDGSGGYTKRTAAFNVLARKKPEDYVYTETEVKSYNALEERIAKLEKTGGGSGGGITFPADAEIGQAIVVTAVDEQGVPTAWEYVDMPDAVSFAAPQDLTESQQMRARKNQGLYSKVETLLEEFDLTLDGGKGYYELGCLERRVDYDVRVILLGEQASYDMTGACDWIDYPEYNHALEVSDEHGYFGLWYSAGNWNANGIHGIPDGTYRAALYNVETTLVPEEFIPPEIARQKEVESQIDKTVAYSVADWGETYEESMSYIKNKPNSDNAVELVVEMGLVEPIASDDGAVYTDADGNVYIL